MVLGGHSRPMVPVITSYCTVNRGRKCRLSPRIKMGWRNRRPRNGGGEIVAPHPWWQRPSVCYFVPATPADAIAEMAFPPGTRSACCPAAFLLSGSSASRTCRRACRDRRRRHRKVVIELTRRPEKAMVEKFVAAVEGRGRWASVSRAWP